MKKLVAQGPKKCTVIDAPEKFIEKPPIDGLCGKTDEDNLGFTYAVLDKEGKISLKTF